MLVYGFFGFILKLFDVMTKNVLIYFSLFISFLSVAFYLYLFLLRRKIKKQNNKAQVSGQRERLETSIYELKEIMLSNPSRFFDNTKLLLQFPNKDLTISHVIPNYSFFKNLGIDITNISIKDKTVFCLMPFHKSFQKTYDIIELACKKTQYDCYRSDIPYNPGNVLRQIVQLLLTSQLIIAVLDGKNPNVFYEIGIAHSIGRTVILIANMNKKDEIPFDLQSDRLLLYSGYNDLTKKFLDTLKNIRYAE